ncbi:hypothetical protein AFR_34760 [Actinoplanes friuliensis DSM 7358]|uniref:DUF4253 domain-containing protein n=1 Tax=Actinoplanes friuliensis DSM 7358 TaxID=1246995 RepID=U5W7N7_9ACTN|nr:hypothetical protein AFR_34760 [Actinoplanes friuliensis DSM 7358]
MRPVKLAELVAESPVVLPDGRLVTPENGGPPAFWLSGAAPAAGLVAELRAGAATTGLQPLLLCNDPRRWARGEVYPAGMSSADSHPTGPLLATWWHEFAPAALASLEPYGEAWPGLAPSGVPGADPDRAAEAFTALLLAGETRLALVAAASGAHALPVLGWWAPGNYTNDTGEIAGVVRGWQDRFGVRVVGISMSELHLSVAAPPRTIEHARQVAAEHYSFCPDQIDQGTGTLEIYARQLTGAAAWSFWWD